MCRKKDSVFRNPISTSLHQLVQFKNRYEHRVFRREIDFNIPSRCFRVRCTKMRILKSIPFYYRIEITTSFHVDLFVARIFTFNWWSYEITAFTARWRFVYFFRDWNVLIPKEVSSTGDSELLYGSFTVTNNDVDTVIIE